MSVIFGRFNVDGKPLSQGIGTNMLEAASWWQPEDKGFIEEDHMLLGVAQAFNTPESVFEKQPYKHPSRELSICSDSRIDNRRELANKLDMVDSSQTPDSSFILKAYENYGEDCVDHLIGAFSFVIWDGIEQKLFCARDQVGVRPLYYYFKDNVFVFASTKRPIVFNSDLDLQCNKRYIINQIGSHSQNPPDTFYRHIKRLLPAHILTIAKNGDMKTRRYWDLDIKSEIYYKKDRDYVEGFRHLMNESVRARIRSNKDVGAELSGGLDSSGVTAVGQQQLKAVGKELTIFSLVMADELIGNVFPYDGEHAKNSETHLIHDLCDKVGIKNKILISESEQKNFLEVIDESLEMMDGIDDYATGMNLIRRKAFDNKVNVILSGFPGDELVTSFCRNYYLEYLSKGQWTKYFNTMRGLWPNYYKMLSLMAHPAIKGLYDFPTPLANQIIKRIFKATRAQKHLRIAKKKSFFTNQYLDKHPGVNKYMSTIKFNRPPFSLKESQRNHVLRAHTSLRMESENLHGLSFGIETRYPLADIRLMQFVLSMPVDQKIKGNQQRLIFRNAMREILPDSIIDRNNKFGSTCPFWHYEYKKIHENRIRFIKAAKERQALEYMDYDKLLEKAELTFSKNKRSSARVYAAGGRQRLMIQLIRYLQLNPEIHIKLDSFRDDY